MIRSIHWFHLIKSLHTDGYCFMLLRNCLKLLVPPTTQPFIFTLNNAAMHHDMRSNRYLNFFFANKETNIDDNHNLDSRATVLKVKKKETAENWGLLRHSIWWWIFVCQQNLLALLHFNNSIFFIRIDIDHYFEIWLGVKVDVDYVDYLKWTWILWETCQTLTILFFFR